MRFWKRQSDRRLEARLRAERPEARDEFVSALSTRMEGHRYTRPRVALGLATTAVLVGALVAFGGVGYAARAIDGGVSSAVSTAKHIVSHPRKTVRHTVFPAPRSPATTQYGCGTLSIHVRWHYRVTGSGSWSSTNSVNCSNGVIVIGPSTMEGDLKVNPGGTIQVGYDFTLPGNNTTHTVTFSQIKVVFTPRCGSSPSNQTLTATMPDATYTVTNQNWYPSGNQSSTLVWQGSVVVPNICNGGQVRFDKGGTFSALVSAT